MEENIKMKKSTIWMISTVVLGLLLVISVLTGGFGLGSNDAGVEENNEPANEVPTVSANSIVDDDAVKGDPNAPVTIVEFSDYECPFCARFYSETFSKIEENYINTGKVKFVYRDFPLSFHANAQKAAEAAECAGDQGKYYEMHDLLFEKGVSGGVDAFKSYAIEIGLDSSEFDSCLDSGKFESEVQKDFEDGRALGVQGTPAFIINGQAISGAQPYEVFKQIIDSELN
mgnify:CR=1 FL=1